MMKITKIILLMIIFMLPILVIAHGNGEDDAPVMNVELVIFEHSLVTILAIALIVVALFSFKRLGKEQREVGLYFLLAGAVIGVIHILEVLIEVLGVIILPDTTMMQIEHIFTYVTLILMIVGFWKWKK